MSRNRKRINGRDGSRMAYAATQGTLGQESRRNRRIDRPVRDQANTSSPPPVPAPTRQAAPPASGGWRAAIAQLLADATGPDVPRAVLRGAMPHVGPLTRRRAAGSVGRRGSAYLGQTLADWERLGWLRRNIDDDTVTVLDRAALRDLAERRPDTPGPSVRPEIIARHLARAIAAGDRLAITRLTGELRAAEDYDVVRLAAWTRVIRSHLADSSSYPTPVAGGG